MFIQHATTLSLKASRVYLYSADEAIQSALHRHKRNTRQYKNPQCNLSKYSQVSFNKTRWQTVLQFCPRPSERFRTEQHNRGVLWPDTCIKANKPHQCSCCGRNLLVFRLRFRVPEGETAGTEARRAERQNPEQD